LNQASVAHPLRVLMVPDTIYWITGTIARQIATHNPWIEATICSSRILEQLLERDPSIVDRIDVAHFIDAFGSKRLLPKFQGQVPCVTTIHHVHDWDGVEHNRNADAVMVVSQEWEKDLGERGIAAERLVWVPNGVDASVFRPSTPDGRSSSRRRLRIAEQAFVIGYFAKKSSDAKNRKGVDIFVAGLVEVAKKVPNTVAVVAGPGWKDMIAQLRAQGVDCRWLPFVVDHEDLSRVYQALDVYWVTARIEGGPVTLLEAMSSEVCCVSTPVGVAREILKDGINGFVTPIGDVAALVARTLQLQQDEAGRRHMAKAGRETVLNGYQWKQTTANARQLYEKAQEGLAEPAGSEQACSGPSSSGGRVRRDAGPFPLNAVDRRLRRWVRMQENLFWLGSGDVADSREAVLKLCLRACRANPLCVTPWAMLLANASPSTYRTLSKTWRLLKKLGGWTPAQG